MKFVLLSAVSSVALTRLSVVLVLSALVTSAAATSGAGTTLVVAEARCSSGTVAAMIAGKSVCLRRGQKCSKRLDRQYHRYGFHCHSARLTGGAKPKPQVPPAGQIVETIRAPSWGGVAIGAGAVWVANTLTHTVTRIDPATNAVAATIPIGEGIIDPFHGPSFLAFGHGTLWVLDGRADCSCVHRINPATNEIVATITLGSPTQGRIAPLGISLQSDAVWVAVRAGTEESPDGSVIRIDPATNSVKAIIPAGVSPDFGGPTGIVAEPGSVWVGVPSLKSVVRIDSTTNSVVATIRGLTCAEGQLAVDESGVWVADCDAVRRIDRSTNEITRTVRIPDATGAGARGIAVGFGSVWAQAGPLVRINPATGVIVGMLPLDPSLIWGEYSVVMGFDSVWVRQLDRVVRIKP